MASEAQQILRREGPWEGPPPSWLLSHLSGGVYPATLCGYEGPLQTQHASHASCPRCVELYRGQATLPLGSERAA